MAESVLPSPYTILPSTSLTVSSTVSVLRKKSMPFTLRPHTSCMRRPSVARYIAGAYGRNSVGEPDYVVNRGDRLGPLPHFGQPDTPARCHGDYVLDDGGA